jgi:hypothetical protein
MDTDGHGWTRMERDEGGKGEPEVGGQRAEGGMEKLKFGKQKIEIVKLNLNRERRELRKREGLGDLQEITKGTETGISEPWDFKPRKTRDHAKGQGGSSSAEIAATKRCRKHISQILLGFLPSCGCIHHPPSNTARVSLRVAPASGLRVRITHPYPRNSHFIFHHPLQWLV